MVDQHDIGWAVEQMRWGQIVTRVKWAPDNLWYKLDPDLGALSHGDNKGPHDGPAELGSRDLFATDWCFYSPPWYGEHDVFDLCRGGIPVGNHHVVADHPLLLALICVKCKKAAETAWFHENRDSPCEPSPKDPP